ncbi:hypothetical protein Tco_1562346 [Tanacetum coccineum]
MTIPFAIVKEESPLFLLFAIHCALCDYRDLQQQLEIDIIDCSLNYHPLSGNTDQLDWSLVGKCSLLMLVSMWEQYIPTMRWITVENTRCGELRLGTHLMDSGPTAKLPILKWVEYEMWDIRIKQYFQIQDYALWEMIENGDSWDLVSQTSQENGITVTKMSTPATIEEKINKKNDVKTRGLLLMPLPNEHQLTFSQYLDAKSMFAAIETNWGIAATQKTQNILLKQHGTLFQGNAEHQESKEGQFRITTTPGSKETRRHSKAMLAMMYDDLLAKLHETEFKAATYKRGLVTVEDQLVTFRKNESLKKLSKKKMALILKLRNFDKASKELDQFVSKLDLSYSGLDEFKEPEFKGYGPENSKQESNVVCETESDNSKENSKKSLVKEQVSQDKRSFVKAMVPNTSKSVSEVEPKKVRKNDGALIIED